MQVRWGIIGCGDVCEVKSGPALYKVPHSQLRIVMRRDESLARSFAERHGVPTYTTSAQAVIEHPEVDAVYIATPPGSHLEYAMKVAAVGKPCYVEKPMARNATECASMLNAFTAANKPLFVAYYRRALPRFLEVARAIRAGDLGELMAVRYVYQNERRRRAPDRPQGGWREDARQAGGGLFLDLGCHVLDLLDFLLGPLQQVTGHAARRSEPGPIQPGTVEDCVALSFATNEGVAGTCSFEFHTTRFVDRLTLVGNLGTLTLSVFGNEPLLFTTERGTRTVAVSHPEHVHSPLVATIVSELTAGPLRCPSTGASALRTGLVMDRVLDAYYGGRSDAFWERPLTWPPADERFRLGRGSGSC